MISRQKMQSLRNNVSIDRMLEELEVPTKVRDGFLRFLCPICREFNTATNPKTNCNRPVTPTLTPWIRAQLELWGGIVPGGDRDYRPGRAKI